MVRPHQPDEAVFRSVLPEDIDWKPFPAFPPSVRLAVVVGQPSEPGPYVISGMSLTPEGTFTLSQASTSPRYRPLVRWTSITCIPATIRAVTQFCRLTGLR